MPTNPTEEEAAYLERRALARRAQGRVGPPWYYRYPLAVDMVIGGLTGGLMGFLFGVVLA